LLSAISLRDCRKHLALKVQLVAARAEKLLALQNANYVETSRSALTNCPTVLLLLVPLLGGGEVGLLATCMAVMQRIRKCAKSCKKACIDNFTL